MLTEHSSVERDCWMEGLQQCSSRLKRPSASCAGASNRSGVMRVHLLGAMRKPRRCSWICTKWRAWMAAGVDHAVMLSVRTRVATARTGILSLQKRDRARLLFALGPHTMPQNFAVASPCSPWRFDRESSTMGAGNPSYLKIRMDATAASISVTA
jgi:hypothetical protein